MSQPLPVREKMSAGDVRSEVDAYRRFHDDGGGSVEERSENYGTMVKAYYDLATDFYERGWGKSFHFAPRVGEESFDASIVRHQHFLALRLGLGPGMTTLDVGCGVGGPMREIARFSGTNIVGVNNNAYQCSKVNQYNAEAKLQDSCSVLESDFMKLSLEDESVDAIYAIEATCHAPDFAKLLQELHRVLKPGGKIAIYEWCLTDKYDGTSSEHRKAKREIEEGNGLPDIRTVSNVREAFTQSAEDGSGQLFELLEHFDKVREDSKETPWYHSLAGRDYSSVGLRRSKVGRRVMSGFINALELSSVAPKGTKETQEFLSRGADALVVGGELDIFTPMAFFLARKN